MKNYGQILLGFTNDGDVVFANVDMSRDYFSVSFDEVAPFIADEDFMELRIENFLEDLEDNYKLEKLEYYDCRPSDLLDELKNDLDIEDVIDISLFDVSYSIEGVGGDIYFESVGSGQHDTRKILHPINGGFSNFIHDMWDLYHLKNTNDIDKNVLKHIEKSVEEYKENINEDELIENHLKEHFDYYIED